MRLQTEQTFHAGLGGTSSKLAIGTVSAASVALSGSNSVVVTPTVDTFFRRGTAPVAVVDTDQFLLANKAYTLYGLSNGDKLAFISAVAGSVYITPHISA